MPLLSFILCVDKRQQDIFIHEVMKCTTVLLLGMYNLNKQKTKHNKKPHQTFSEHKKYVLLHLNKYSDNNTLDRTEYRLNTNPQTVCVHVQKHGNTVLRLSNYAQYV